MCICVCVLVPVDDPVWLISKLSQNMANDLALFKTLRILDRSAELFLLQSAIPGRGWGSTESNRGIRKREKQKEERVHRVDTAGWAAPKFTPVRTWDLQLGIESRFVPVRWLWGRLQAFALEMYTLSSCGAKQSRSGLMCIKGELEEEQLQRTLRLRIYHLVLSLPLPHAYSLSSLHDVIDIPLLYHRQLLLSSFPTESF